MAKRSKVAHFTLSCPATKLEMQPQAEVFVKEETTVELVWFDGVWDVTLLSLYTSDLLKVQLSQPGLEVESLLFPESVQVILMMSREQIQKE